MSLKILLLIFGIICESFRDTWFRDDFGIFRNVFRILDLNPGICVSNIFIFLVKENIFSLSILFLFPFSLFLFLPPQSTRIPFSKIPTIPKFHFLPHTSTNFLINAPLSLSLPWPAKWPKEGHLILSYLQKPPLFYINCTSFTKSKSYINFSFTFLFLFFTSTKIWPSPKSLLHLNLNPNSKNTTKSSSPSQATTTFGLGSCLLSPRIKFVGNAPFERV